MIELSAIECRILGSLVEKAHTTGSSQYPMSLNGLTTACNQKSNREPVTNYTEDQVQQALDGLTRRNLAISVSSPSSRVWKYKHNLREALQVGTSELVILAEMLLRGPQTLGELRSRGSRMHPLESLDVVHNLIEHMQQRDEPLVRQIDPAPGSRAERFGQLLCKDLHPIESAPKVRPVLAEASDNSIEHVEMLSRIEALELRVESLADALKQLTEKLGEPDPGLL
ncbi:MAG: YceH family protein [Phycisphaerae bacterium]